MNADPSNDVDQKSQNSLESIIEAYKQHVDRTLLRQNLKLSVPERFEKHESFMAFVTELRAGERPRE